MPKQSSPHKPGELMSIVENISKVLIVQDLASSQTRNSCIVLGGLHSLEPELICTENRCFFLEWVKLQGNEIKHQNMLLYPNRYQCNMMKVHWERVGQQGSIFHILGDTFQTHTKSRHLIFYKTSAVIKSGETAATWEYKCTLSDSRSSFLVTLTH